MAAAAIPQLGPPPASSNGWSYFNPSAPGAYNPFNQRDVYNQYQQIGQNQFATGQGVMGQQQNLANYYNQNSAQYGNLANQLYSPIWNGGGGYTPDQMTNVLQSQGLSDLVNQGQNNFLTPEAQASMTGNPYQAQQQFAPQAQQLEADATQGASNLQGAAVAGQTFGNTNLSNWQQNLNNSINPSQLQVSQSYQPNMQNALNTGAGQLNAAETNPALDPTSQYLQQAGVSDQQVADIGEAAARSVGAQYGATKDAITQAAEASGYGTPLGIASALTGLDRSSSADEADALTNARLQALSTQRQAAQNIQNTQLNAGQYKSGLESSNALAEQNANIAADTTAEQLRLGANQYLTGAQMGAANTIGQAGQQNVQYNTNNMLNAIGQGTQMGLATGEYNASTNANLGQTAEQQATNRATTIGLNNQSTNMYNQNVGINANNTMASRYQAAYAPWLANQQEGRQAATGEQQYYGGQGNTATSQQLQEQGLSTQGQLGAAGGYANWGESQNNSGFGSNLEKSLGAGLGKGLTTGFGGEHGKYVDHHQLIEVGEHDRPEMIIPLDPNTPPQHQNPYEKLGSSIGELMGIHKGYAAGGMIGINDPNDFTRDLEGENLAEHPEDVSRYARGGMVSIPRPMMPHLSMSHMAPRMGGIHLNMPLRMPRLSAPIRPAALPMGGPQKFAMGGIVGDGYQPNRSGFQPSQNTGRGMVSTPQGGSVGWGNTPVSNPGTSSMTGVSGPSSPYTPPQGGLFNSNGSVNLNAPPSSSAAPPPSGTAMGWGNTPVSNPGSNSITGVSGSPSPYSPPQGGLFNSNGSVNLTAPAAARVASPSSSTSMGWGNTPISNPGTSSMTGTPGSTPYTPPQGGLFNSNGSLNLPSSSPNQPYALNSNRAPQNRIRQAPPQPWGNPNQPQSQLINAPNYQRNLGSMAPPKNPNSYAPYMERTALHRM